MAPSDQLQYQVQTLRGLVAGVRPDQMTNPTPCAKWTVHDLLNHFIGGAGMFAAAFSGEDVRIDPDAPTPDLVGGDAVSSFDAAIGAFKAAVDQPGAMDRIIKLPFGDIPGPAVLGILEFDLTVHCWDLATATGQAFDPPDDVVVHADAMARQIISPQLRNGDTFADSVAPAASATPLQKLVAFTGRQP